MGNRFGVFRLGVSGYGSLVLLVFGFYFIELLFGLLFVCKH